MRSTRGERVLNTLPSSTCTRSHDVPRAANSDGKGRLTRTLPTGLWVPWGTLGTPEVQQKQKPAKYPKSQIDNLAERVGFDANLSKSRG